MNKTKSTKKPTIAITLGDPSGIGPEIILKALKITLIQKMANFLIIREKKIIKKAAPAAGVDWHRIISIDEKRLSTTRFKVGNFYLLDLKNIRPTNFQIGQSSVLSGRAAMEYLEKAASLAQSKKIQAVVTGPISKEAINAAGYKYPGQTEFFAAKTCTKNYAMLFDSPSLKIILVTIHTPLRTVPKKISSPKILNCLRLGYNFLKKLKIKKPKIAVAGLNPHAGEHGLLGSEEKQIIEPAIQKARKAGLPVVGPFPADVIFKKALEKKFDLVVAMYHDQGLIPLKMVAFDQAVNITLGLPFVRTSPDHGTAFDIAGKGIANPGSLIAALQLAAKLSKHHQQHQTLP